MNGPDHYAQAEQLLADASKVVRRHDDECPEADRMIAEAAVHAALALAAATALCMPPHDNTVTPDEAAWARVSQEPAKQTAPQLTAADLIGMDHPHVTIPGVHDDQPVCILDALLDGDRDDHVTVTWQDPSTLYPTKQATIPADTTIRLAGSA